MGADLDNLDAVNFALFRFVEGRILDKKKR